MEEDAVDGGQVSVWRERGSERAGAIEDGERSAQRTTAEVAVVGLMWDSQAGILPLRFCA